MPIKYYRNKTSYRIVYILKELNSLIKLEYVESGYTIWYTRKDFDKMFKEVP